MTKQRLRTCASLLGVVVLGCLLVGCGNALGGVSGSTSLSTAVTPTASTTGHTSHLTCIYMGGAQPIDTVSVTLHCTVTHASSSDTAFKLLYTVKGNTGQPETLSPACQGKLTGGSGQCTQTYTTIAPHTFSVGTVAGTTQPSQGALGPVVPTEAPIPGATPTSPFLPYPTLTPLPMQNG